MYHLNGLVLCRGTTLEYTPDERESRDGAVVLENALTDTEKAMTGMGTKVLIWPDKKAFDTETGELTDLAAAWELGGGQMTVTPCDGEGRTYTPDGVGTDRAGKPGGRAAVFEGRRGRTLRCGKRAAEVQREEQKVERRSCCRMCGSTARGLAA